MPAIADVSHVLRLEVASSEVRALHTRIVSVLAHAQVNGLDFGRTERAVQEMIAGDHSVSSVFEVFTLGEDMSMREWSVTVRLKSGATVMLTHHS